MPPKRLYLHHGLSALDGALKRVEEGEDWTERVGPVGAALREMRAELLDAIGGVDVASPQQHMLVDPIVRTHLMIESADLRPESAGLRPRRFHAPTQAPYSDSQSPRRSRPCSCSRPSRNRRQPA